MLINMLLFELKYQFRKPATHVFALLMFMLAFLFLGTDAASVGGGAYRLSQSAAGHPTLW